MKKIIIKLLVVILTFFLVFISLIKIVKMLPGKERRLANDLYLNIISDLSHLSDRLFIKTYFYQNQIQSLPMYHLVIPENGLDNLNLDANKALEMNFNSKTNLHQEKSKLIFNQQVFPATVNLHGTTKNNYKFYKKSFQIKLDNKQTINSTDTINLINPLQHNFLAPMLTNLVAQKLNLVFNQQYPVYLKINDSNVGVYTYEEPLDNNLLTNHLIENAQIINLKDTWAENHYNNPIGLNAHHLSAFDFEIANVESIKTDSQTILYKLNSLYKSIKENDVTKIVEFFDLDYLARYDAYREFFGVDHDSAGDNQKFFYSSKEQKFYPIARGEGDINKLAIVSGTTLKSYNSYDSHITEQYAYPRLFLILNQSSEFRKLKYQYLQQLIEDYPEIKKEFKKIFDQYADFYIYDNKDFLSVIAKRKLHRDLFDIVDFNQNLISQQLSFSSVFINIINHGSYTDIEIIPDSVAPIGFEKFELILNNLLTAKATINNQPIILSDNVDINQIINQEIILSKLDDEYKLIPTTYLFSIKSSTPFNINNINIRAINRTTNDLIKDIHIGIATQ
ncbi:MAG: hypothetical protein ABIJ43_03555 [Candidatus Beckwithbacteria bacterium]